MCQKRDYDYCYGPVVARHVARVTDAHPSAVNASVSAGLPNVAAIGDPSDRRTI